MRYVNVKHVLQYHCKAKWKGWLLAQFHYVDGKIMTYGAKAALHFAEWEKNNYRSSWEIKLSQSAPLTNDYMTQEDPNLLCVIVT